jgi:hypothetical protein
VSGRFWIDSPAEWQGEPIDPWSGGPYTCYVLAQDIGHARETYLAYRDGDDELGIAFLRSGAVAGTLDEAEEAVVVAGLEGKTPTIFRVVGTVDESNER